MNAAATAPSPGVVIFRKRLLPYSETFIADQGHRLSRYRPLYCGFRRDPSGLALLGDAPRALLDDTSPRATLDKLRFRLGLGGARAWLETIRAHRPALVHAHFLADGIDAARLGRLLALPTVTTLHGHDISKHPAGGSRATRTLFDRAGRVIAVSHFIAREALARGCPESKLRQHYIGIDLDKFSLPRREVDTPSLLFVGRLVEKKGCTYLLQAMEALRDRVADLSLRIIGDGILKPALEREAAERKLAVEFVGSVAPETVRDELARCWLFVAPSVTATDGDVEGLGMVFLEAQALEVPVVSFASGGVVEAVVDGETGLLCAEKDVAALADNIAQLLENTALRHQMGQRGRARVEAQFDIRKQCALLEQIYDEII